MLNEQLSAFENYNFIIFKYNGVPDWNYEEEIIGTTNTIYWSPNGESFVFIAFDVTDIPLLEYSVYPDHRAASRKFSKFPQFHPIKRILL